MSGHVVGTEPRPFATKAEWAYDVLRRRITSGTLKPGDRLRLTALARELGISEMPVREALRMLDRERLVRLESHRGATVADVTLERAIEIIAVRTHLEVLALEEAALRHDATSLAALERQLVRMARAAARGEARRFSELNRVFHRALYAPGPNATLKAEIESLWDRLWQTRERSIFALAPARMLEAHAEHEAILAAVRRGDARAASRAGAAHRRATLEAWQQALAASPGRRP